MKKARRSVGTDEFREGSLTALPLAAGSVGTDSGEAQRPGRSVHLDEPDVEGERG